MHWHASCFFSSILGKPGYYGFMVIPNTTPDQYITGMAALSVPFDGILSDWHFCTAFLSGKKPIPIAGRTMPSTSHLWGRDQIEDQSAYFIGAGLPIEGHVWVASPARAVADLLYKNNAVTNGDLSYLCVADIPMSETRIRSLATMAQLLMDRYPTMKLQKWIEHQPLLVMTHA